MTDKQSQPNEMQSKPVRTSRSYVAGIVALIALAAVIAAWFWTTRQPPQPQANLGLPHGVMVAGAGAFVAALIAQIRAMSFMDVLEAAGDLIVGLFSLIGSVLKTIWNAILGLFGWN